MDDFFVRNRLSAYLDGELPVAEAREVEAALARHPHLREEYERMRDAVELLRREGPLKVPPRLAARIAERVKHEPIRAGWWGRVRAVRGEVWALAAAAVLAVVVVTRPADAPQPPPTDAVPAAVPLLPDLTPATEPQLEAAPPSAPVTADGRLGDEVAAVGAGARQTFAEPTRARAGARAASTRAGAAEKQPFEADWEQDDAAAEPVAAAENTATAQTVAFAGPAFRYKLRAEDDAVLKQLHAAARDLGGTLTDESGRPLSDYPMNAGDARSVRIQVPTYNVEALVARLRTLGVVDELAAERDVLYAPGAQVPVSIYVVRE